MWSVVGEAHVRRSNDAAWVISEIDVVGAFGQWNLWSGAGAVIASICHRQYGASGRGL
jgi:hypothetical protein